MRRVDGEQLGDAEVADRRCYCCAPAVAMLADFDDSELDNIAISRAQRPGGSFEWFWIVSRCISFVYVDSQRSASTR